MPCFYDERKCSLLKKNKKIPLWALVFFLIYIFTVYLYVFLSFSFGNTLNERNMAIELVRTHIRTRIKTHIHESQSAVIINCVKSFAVSSEVYKWLYHPFFFSKTQSSLHCDLERKLFSYCFSSERFSTVHKAINTSVRYT